MENQAAAILYPPYTPTSYLLGFTKEGIISLYQQLDMTNRMLSCDLRNHISQEAKLRVDYHNLMQEYVKYKQSVDEENSIHAASVNRTTDTKGERKNEKDALAQPEEKKVEIHLSTSVASPAVLPVAPPISQPLLILPLPGRAILSASTSSTSPAANPAIAPAASITPASIHLTSPLLSSPPPPPPAPVKTRAVLSAKQEEKSKEKNSKNIPLQPAATSTPNLNPNRVRNILKSGASHAPSKHDVAFQYPYTHPSLINRSRVS